MKRKPTNILILIILLCFIILYLQNIFKINVNILNNNKQQQEQDLYKDNKDKDIYKSLYNNIRNKNDIIIINKRIEKLKNKFNLYKENKRNKNIKIIITGGLVRLFLDF